MSIETNPIASGNDMSFIQTQNEKEKKIQSIFRAAPVGIGMVINRVITEVNDKLCEMTGYSADELLGLNAKILYPADEDYQYVGKEKYDMINKKGSGSVETRWKKKNGEIIYIILSSSPIDINDYSKGVMFVALDISERKIFEETIHMRDIQLKNIAVNIPATLFQYYIKNNGESGFHFISESSEQIFGLKNDPDDYLDKFTSHITLEYRDKFLKSIDQSVKNKIPWEFSGIFVKDSGESIWFRLMANPTFLEDEILYDGIWIDVTSKVQYLSLIERANKLESLSLLAGGIAHDFNNLLGGIFGYIEMAKNYSSSDKVVTGYLDNALKIFDRTKALTGQLLTFSRGGEPVKKYGSISQVLMETTKFLMNGSDHSYDFNFPGNLLNCEFDHEQICRAFENIITNAIQAMPAGGSLYVSAENIDTNNIKLSYMKPGKYIRITIKDSGTGIPQEMLPKIFDPFFTTKKKCSGLGLATCHSIISKHHGYIDVDSSPGKGSIFYIYLPASEKETVIKHPDITDNTVSKGNILLMDDEVFIRETIGAMLKLIGYNVYKVADGDEALDTLEEEIKKGVNFTAIILDLTIQNGMGGKETISRIREMGIKIPAFAASGYSDDPVISRPREFGFTDSLRKPFRMEDLIALINNYLP